jgi:glutaminyl-tRNA synthetase
MLEPSLSQASPEERFQFERHGYFVADRIDSKPGAPVFNRAVGLKDSWGSGQRG